MNDNRMIRIMVFEPGRAPYTTMLEDSLEHRQELVGGDIECIPLPCETVLCCNASGKLTGLPENRQYGPDILHGTFFLYCDTPEGRGVSLTDEQIAMYQEYFPQPVPAAVPGAAEGFGLQWESISTDDPQAVVDTLASGKLIVALMSKGHFTSSGHFMVLRGVTSEGKILVADPASKKRSEQEWDISIILDEARKGAAAGGPLWAIY